MLCPAGMPDFGVHPGMALPPPLGPEPFWPGLMLNPALGLPGAPAFPWHSLPGQPSKALHMLSQYMLLPFLPPQGPPSSPPLRPHHLHLDSAPSPDDLRSRSRAASQSPQGPHGPHGATPPLPPQSHSPLDARKSSSIDNLRLAAKEHARREALSDSP